MKKKINYKYINQAIARAAPNIPAGFQEAYLRDEL